MTTTTFEIRGIPTPQGFIESRKKSRTLQESVRYAILAKRMTKIAAPISVDITYTMPRPKSHYGTGLNALTIRPGAPAFPAGRPTLDKLTRAVLNGFNESHLLVDESQIVSLNVMKVYCDSPTALAGAVVSFNVMEKVRA